MTINNIFLPPLQSPHPAKSKKLLHLRSSLFEYILGFFEEHPNNLDFALLHMFRHKGQKEGHYRTAFFQNEVLATFDQLSNVQNPRLDGHISLLNTFYLL